MNTVASYSISTSTSCDQWWGTGRERNSSSVGMSCKPIRHLRLLLEDSSNTNMQRTCIRCDVLRHVHASERLDWVHIHPPPPLFHWSSFFWAVWTFRLISFWLLQLCKMILNGHLDNGRALLSLIAPDDDQRGSLEPPTKELRQQQLR